MKKKRDWYGLVDIFLGGIFFTALVIISCRYGITSAFFHLNDNGTWENIINIGFFWMFGIFSLNAVINGIEKIQGREN